MSVMRCDGCDDYVDTDYNVEGIFEDAKPYRYYCGNCIDRQHATAMDVIRIQDPDLYKELTT